MTKVSYLVYDWFGLTLYRLDGELYAVMLRKESSAEHINTLLVCPSSI